MKVFGPVAANFASKQKKSNDVMVNCEVAKIATKQE